MARKATALRAALSLGLLLLAPAGARAAGWSRPFRFAGPFSDDITSPGLVVSSSGQAALAFALQDEDHPWVSEGLIVLRSPSGRVKKLTVPGAKEVLATGFAGSTLDLLTGTSPSGTICCTGAQLTALSGSRFSRKRTLVSGLFGGVDLGRLQPLSGAKFLAAVASDHAVWAGVSTAAGGVGPMRRVSAASSWPQSLAATSLAGGRALVAWSSAPGLTDEASSIDVATGSVGHPPRRPGLMLRMPAGYSVDELAAAPAPRGGTVAWIESWFDASGAYHSAVVVVDLTGGLRPRTFEIPGEIAGGLSLAGDAAGDQALAFKACGQLRSCGVFALAKSARGHYGQPQPLGTIDASQAPAAAVSQRGTALVGWIDQGEVVFSGRARAAGGFGAAKVVSATSYGADLTVAPGPGGGAMAAWTQGALAPSAMGALYSP